MFKQCLKDCKEKCFYQLAQRSALCRELCYLKDRLKKCLKMSKKCLKMFKNV